MRCTGHLTLLHTTCLQLILVQHVTQSDHHHLHRHNPSAHTHSPYSHHLELVDVQCALAGGVQLHESVLVRLQLLLGQVEVLQVLLSQLVGQRVGAWGKQECLTDVIPSPAQGGSAGRGDSRRFLAGIPRSSLPSGRGTVSTYTYTEVPRPLLTSVFLAHSAGDVILIGEHVHSAHISTRRNSTVIRCSSCLLRDRYSGLTCWAGWPPSP